MRRAWASMPRAINNSRIRRLSKAMYSNGTRTLFTSKKWLNGNSFRFTTGVTSSYILSLFINGTNLAFDCLMLFGRESEHWQVRIRAQYFFPFKRHNVSVLLRGGQHSCLLDKSRVGVVEWFSWKNISSKCTILLFLSPLRIWLNHLSGFKLSAFSPLLLYL